TPTYVIGIQKVPGLDYIELDKDDQLRVGAMTTLWAIERSQLVHDKYPVLYEAVHQIHSVQAKIMGTAVGNICTGTPASDVASILLALGGRLKIVGKSSEKTVPAEDFFIGTRQTILQPDEMVTEIKLPPVTATTGHAFYKLTKTTADIGKLNVSAAITIDGDQCKECRIALGSVAPTPMRARQAENTLMGKKPDDETISETARAAAAESRPITDIWSTEEYRTEMIKVLVRRAINRALERAGQ
ncbi:MAG: xanthine dehydrogenase family protein subunit M, partial [Deltaproteobacteria bacterium]|nr:xanthine dehydrogenase family protein subunit M [Deltaproteobacteria bacterium]